MDMKKMMKQAQKMQRDAAAAQQEIAAMTFEASAGGGMVKATATGEMAITDITIDPAAVDPEDVEMLQDMVVAAVNEALRAASEAANARMNAVMGGMKIPGLMRSRAVSISRRYSCKRHLPFKSSSTSWSVCPAWGRSRPSAWPTGS